MSDVEVVEGDVVEQENTVAAIQPADDRMSSSLVRPAAATKDVEVAFQEYQAVCRAILDDSDYQSISGRKFLKKSGWRKLAVAFGVSFEKKERIIDRSEQGDILRSEFTYRAVAPNGRYADGWGACDAFERCCLDNCNRNHTHCNADPEKPCLGFVHFSHAEHDIPATAETRAKNRAASDLFGMGQVSAEEVIGEGEGKKAAPRKKDTGDGLTQPQMRAIRGLMGRKEIPEEKLQDSLGKRISELTKSEASKLIDTLQKHPDPEDPKTSEDVKDARMETPEPASETQWDAAEKTYGSIDLAQAALEEYFPGTEPASATKAQMAQVILKGQQ